MATFSDYGVAKIVDPVLQQAILKKQILGLLTKDYSKKQECKIKTLRGLLN